MNRPVDDHPPGSMIESCDSYTTAFSAAVILKHLCALKVEIPGVQKCRDIECIHRMRVASRRLRVSLALFPDCYRHVKPRKCLREIQRLTRSLGEARDTDVQIALLQTILKEIPDPINGSGIRRLLLRLRQQRFWLQEKVLQAIDRFEGSEYVTDLLEAATLYRSAELPEQVASYAIYNRAATNINSRLQDLLTYERYLFEPDEKEKLHAMRISAKHLRYTLEAFLPVYAGRIRSPLEASRTIQELVGQIHDCDVWIDFIPRFIENEQNRTMQFYGRRGPFNRLIPGLDYFVNNRQEERNRSLEQVQSLWRQWKKQGLWPKLSRITSKPVLHPDAIFPPVFLPDGLPDYDSSI
jgi:CHAD domain-containing protein